MLDPVTSALRVRIGNVNAELDECAGFLAAAGCPELAEKYRESASRNRLFIQSLEESDHANKPAV